MFVHKKRPCIYCKELHAYESCPLYKKSLQAFSHKLSDEITGASPTPFVGRFGYPKVNVGILTPPDVKEDAWLYDAPRYWEAKHFSIPQVVGLRGQLVNARQAVNIKQPSRFVEHAQEIAMASRPADVEISLHKRPVIRLHTNTHHAPFGPVAQVKSLAVTSNTKVHTKVDKVVADTDFKAVDAMNYLFSRGFDENIIARLLSVGTLGIGKDRKLVPTRWSITATDDTIGKQLIQEIKKYPEHEYALYFGEYLGNYYLLFFFPDVWSYELFEAYLPNKPVGYYRYSTDYEPYAGRKNYAEQCAGGYYTVRLAILEELKRVRRQASVLALRFITDEYALPLGVWVTRQAARRATKIAMFPDQNTMFTYAQSFIKQYFSVDLAYFFKRSKMLTTMRTQTKLSSFL